MSLLEGLKSNYKLFGFYGILLATKARLERRALEVTVTVDGIKHPIYLRLRTTDASLFEEIIVNSEYQFEPDRQPLVIVDAGANIGLTSVYFANKFPEAKIIAIEPEESNFKMLKKNTSNYPNIFPIQGALWKEESLLNLSNPETGSWGFQTQEQQSHDLSAEGRIPGMTIGKLMEQYSIDYIDVLKIDIEGSEKEVFESSAPWIDKVGAIIIELHDNFKVGCSRSVYAATTDFELEWRKGELTFFVKNNQMQSPPRYSPELIESTTGRSSPMSPRLQYRIVSVER